MAAQPLYSPNNNSTVIRLYATVADLLALHDDEYRYELIGGVIIRMPPPQHHHGLIIMRLSAFLIPYCAAQGMQDRLLAEVGYQLVDERTVLAPDISIAQSPPQAGETYSTIAPLLAVEIASPSQTRSYFVDKARIFLTAGTQMVWVVWPDSETVDVYTMAGVASGGTQDMLTGGSVLPGFSCPVASLFS